MTISGFSVTPAFVAPGESIHVEFTVSVTSSDTVNGLYVYAGNGASFVIYHDDDFRLAAGKSKKIAFDTVISKDNVYISKNMGDNRYITDPSWNIVLGSFGSSKSIANPIVYLNMRYTPKITEFAMKRAVDGKFNDEGVHVITTLKLSIVPEADLSKMTLRLYYAESVPPTTASGYLDLTDKIPDLITGVVDSVEVVQNSFSNGIDWYFMLVFGDSWEQDSANASLPRAFANLHLSGQPNGGACFGGFSSSTNEEPKLESYYPCYFYGGITGVTNYSTDEVKTGGTWIDNKPIYRRTFKTTNGKATTDVTLGTIANLAEVISTNGYVKYYNNHFSLSFFRNDTYYHRTMVSSNGNVTVHCCQPFSAVVTVEYTKTTD